MMFFDMKKIVCRIFNAAQQGISYLYHHLFLVMAGGALIFSLLSVFVSIATNTIPRGVFYNADSLYIPMFYQDLFSEYSLWGWKHPPATYFFPDIFFYGILNAVLDNFHFAIMGFALGQSVLFIASVIFLSHKVFGKHKGLDALILVVGTCFFLTLATGKCRAFVPILQNGYHFGAFLIGILSLALALTILEDEGEARYVYVWTLVLSGLTTFTFMSDAIYAVQVVLPLGITLLFLSVVSSVSLRSLRLLYFGIFPALFLGSGLNRFLLIYRVSENTGTVLTVEKILSNLSRAAYDLVYWDDFSPESLPLFHAIWIAFVAISLAAFGNVMYKALRHRAKLSKMPAMPWAVMLWGIGLFLLIGHLFFRWSFWVVGPMSLLIGFLLVALERKTPRPLSKTSFDVRHSKFLFILTFFLACYISNIGSVAMLGKAVSRRLIPSLLIPLFFGWPFLLGGSKRARAFLTNTRALNLLVGGGFLLMVGVNIRPVLQDMSALSGLADFYPEFVACVDEHARKYNIKNGLSQYWFAKQLSLLSKNGLHVVQVRHGERSPLAPEHWINNFNWYHKKFEFIITEERPYNPRNIYAKAMMRYFGIPAHVFVCDKKAVFVYNRPQDTRFQEQFASDFFLEILASDLPSDTGTIERTSRIAQAPGDKEGSLTYGPYHYLYIGKYAFEIHAYAQKDTNRKNVGKWEVLTYPEETFAQGPENAQVIQKGEIERDGNQVISGTFTIQRDELKTEIRISYKGTGVLRVDKLIIRRIY